METPATDQAPESNSNGSARERRKARVSEASRKTIGAMERELEHAGDAVWSFLKRRPGVGVVLASGIGFGVASAVGVGELAIAIAAGYAAYQVLRNNEPPSKALREVAGIGRDIGA